MWRVFGGAFAVKCERTAKLGRQEIDNKPGTYWAARFALALDVGGIIELKRRRAMLEALPAR